MAAGATPVCTGQGGQPDIVDHEKNGYIANEPKAATIASYIDRALRSPFSRAEQHHTVANKFSADRIAAAYRALF
jgi:glycosyltransferase involved in cell wall biosynthesis